MTGRHRRRLGGRLAHDFGQVDGLAQPLAPGVGAGQQEQIGHEPPHPARGTQRRVGHLPLLARELGLEQLEVGEDARQGGAQLVRGVRDELALTGQRTLGLAARGVECPQHVLERARQVGDLVVGLRLRQLDGRVTRPGDVAGRAGEPGDRRHRPAGEGQAGEEGERGTAEDAERKEQVDARDGVADAAERLRVLEAGDHLAVGIGQLARDDQVAMDAVRTGARRSEVDVGPDVVVVAVEGHDVDRGRARRRRLDRLQVALDDRPRHRRLDGQLLLQVGGGHLELVVELRTNLLPGEHADDDGEQQEDRERQARGDQRQPDSHRQSPQPPHAARSTYPAPRTV